MSSDADNVDNPANGCNGLSSSKMVPQEVEQAPGMGTMIERQYNVSKREAPINSKRKSEDPAADDDDEEMHKRAKHNSSHVAGSGIVGEYLRAERAKGAAESGPTSSEAVDLTKDNDDVIFIGATSGKDTGNQEVVSRKDACQSQRFSNPVPSQTSNGCAGQRYVATDEDQVRKACHQKSCHGAIR